ncbi:hypothetical protein ABVK25_007249 [Lepraria finkii]|uniref:Uncharacterized protein n=1 Tax=Lepraria finkii TaxID=1340010 RepID=A0ABR4B3A6_9LECA
MRSLSHLFLLLPFFVYTVLTLNLNVNIPPPSNQTSSLSVYIRCAETSRFTPRRPRFSDCAGAIRQLPSKHYPGRFHTGVVADQFKLPVATCSGACSAVVVLIDGAPETEAAWFENGLAATQLNIACVGAGIFSKLKGNSCL